MFEKEPTRRASLSLLAACHAGTPLNCNDGNACTTDSCNASSGCVHTPISGCTACTTASQCNDGNPCTTDTCTAGRCQSTAVTNGTTCGDGNTCNGLETCQSGTCKAAALEGAACDTVLGPTCLVPARCVTGVSGTKGMCTLPSPTAC